MSLDFEHCSFSASTTQHLKTKHLSNNMGVIVNHISNKRVSQQENSDWSILNVINKFTLNHTIHEWIKDSKIKTTPFNNEFNLII